MDMKLYGAIVVYNEEPIVKYIMPYLTRYGFDKLYIYDDGCTDNTIDLIKSYNCDYIEFRDFSKYLEMNNGEFDLAKANVYADLFFAGKNESIKTGEDVWVYHSDFDEVIFNFNTCSNKNGSIKEYIDFIFKRFEANYYAGRTVNIIKGKESTSELAHTFKDTKCFYWNYWGQKVFLLKCNDFSTENFVFGSGNHFLALNLEKGKKAINIYECGGVYSFHFKYFTYEYYEYKNKNSSVRNVCPFLYLEDSEAIKEHYIRETGCKFPLEMFFALSGFFVNNPLPTINYGNFKRTF